MRIIPAFESVFLLLLLGKRGGNEAKEEILKDVKEEFAEERFSAVNQGVALSVRFLAHLDIIQVLLQVAVEGASEENGDRAPAWYGARLTEKDKYIDWYKTDDPENRANATGKQVKERVGSLLDDLETADDPSQYRMACTKMIEHLTLTTLNLTAFGHVRDLEEMQKAVEDILENGWERFEDQTPEEETLKNVLREAALYIEKQMLHRITATRYMGMLARPAALLEDLEAVDLEVYNPCPLLVAVLKSTPLRAMGRDDLIEQAVRNASEEADRDERRAMFQAAVETLASRGVLRRAPLREREDNRPVYEFTDEGNEIASLLIDEDAFLAREPVG